MERKAREGLVALAKRLQIPLVATHDVRYAAPEDYELVDYVFCMEANRQYDATTRLSWAAGHYMRSPADMYAAFAGLEDAVRQSQNIADSMDLNLEPAGAHCHGAEPFRDSDSNSQLRQQCLDGLAERYRDRPTHLDGSRLQTAVLERLDRELQAIQDRGYADYLLVLGDLVTYARAQDIPVAVRGAAAGSLAVFALSLSHIDPLEHGLLFEPFLSGTFQVPKITVDVHDQWRDKIIEYARQKYGPEKVAQIGTFGRPSATSTVRELASVLGMNTKEAEAAVKVMAVVSGNDLITAGEPNTTSPEACNADPRMQKLFEWAAKIQSIRVQLGSNASGVVVSDNPITNRVPVYVLQGSSVPVTQWPMPDVEAFGLKKFDILGCRALSLISLTCGLIEGNHSQKIEPFKTFSWTIPRRWPCYPAAKRTACSYSKARAYASGSDAYSPVGSRN